MTKPQRGTLYMTDGRVLLLTPRNGKEFTLEELQKAVGGYIESATPLNKRTKLWVNEEGFIHNLPRNPHSQTIVDLVWHGVPYLAGNIIATYRIDPGMELGDADARLTVDVALETK